MNPTENDGTPRSAAEDRELAAELRLLRYAEPAADLRRRTLAAAAAELAAPPRRGFAQWWPELALAAAAILLLSLSGAVFPAAPQASPAPVKAPIGIAAQLGLGQDLGGYLEQRWAAAKGPAAPSRFAGLS